MHIKARQDTTSDPDLLLPSTPTKTSIPTSISPSTDPSFDFIPSSTITTCSICNITWIVSNPELVNLTGVGINLEVAGIRDNFTLSDIIVATNVPVISEHFTWNPVNVRPGRYEIFGRWSDKHGATVKSQLFDVKAGNTTACLTDSTGTSSAPPNSTSHTAPESGTVFAIVVECLVVFVLLAILTSIIVGPLRNFYRRRRRRGDGPNSPVSESSASRDVSVSTHHPVHHTGDSLDDHLSNSTNNPSPTFVQLPRIMTRIPTHTLNPPDSEPSASRDVIAGYPSTDSVYDYLGNNVTFASAQLTPLTPSIPSSTLIIEPISK